MRRIQSEGVPFGFLYCAPSIYTLLLDFLEALEMPGIRHVLIATERGCEYSGTLLLDTYDLGLNQVQRPYGLAKYPCRTKLNRFRADMVCGGCLSCRSAAIAARYQWT